MLRFSISLLAAAFLTFAGYAALGEAAAPAPAPKVIVTVVAHAHAAVSGRPPLPAATIATL